ncbi:MAG: sulfotransferase family protein [Nitrosospira sp.]|nr:sulfotransferase family protein [Nitrosospira sp.]
MLVSHTRQFLFIHVQKTAGTSITRHIKRHVADATDYLRPHDPYVLALRDSTVVHSDYFKVAFVRNPFERLVSWYTDIRSGGRRLSEQEKIGTPNYNRVRQHVREHASNFSEFVSHCADATDRSGWKPFRYNQADYLVDESDVMSMDFVGRFESLQADFDTLSSRLGIDRCELPHDNHSSHRPYRDYYTPSLRRIVEARFAKDCKLFGYRF